LVKIWNEKNAWYEKQNLSYMSVHMKQRLPLHGLMDFHEILYSRTFIKTCQANSGVLVKVGQKYGAYVGKNIYDTLNSFWNEESLKNVKKIQTRAYTVYVCMYVYICISVKYIFPENSAMYELGRIRP